MRPLHAPLVALLALSLFGCAPGRSGGDDDDDADAYGGLDTDGDGDLDPDDVAAGEGAVFLTLDFVDPDGAPAPSDRALTTTDIALQQTFAAWNLHAVFSGAGTDGLTLDLRFELEGDLSTGLWAVSNGSASGPDGGWYAYSSEAGGDVEITEVGDGVGSGQFAGTAELDVLGSNEAPTGEVVRITGFAFRDAPAESTPM